MQNSTRTEKAQITGIFRLRRGSDDGLSREPKAFVLKRPKVESSAMTDYITKFLRGHRRPPGDSEIRTIDAFKMPHSAPDHVNKLEP